MLLRKADVGVKYLAQYFGDSFEKSPNEVLRSKFWTQGLVVQSPGTTHEDEETGVSTRTCRLHKASWSK
uniref:HTH_48 domain-containing protein n=1 Tax=Bursaphelenchus xylophilus TaxID=6326 RepID=A0A1I7SNJ8_BURXY